MKKTAPLKTRGFLSALVILLVLSVCSCAQVSNPEKSIDTSAKTSKENSLYDYALIYSYHNTEYNTENFAKIAELLQSKGSLTVASTNYNDDNGILKIAFQLKLSEKEPNYRVDISKEMQDAIVLLAVFDYIKGVEINFTQADYTFGGVPIMRADAEKVFGKTIAPFGNTKKAFTEEFPDSVQAVVWDKEVMNTVNYHHVMGLDE